MTPSSSARGPGIYPWIVAFTGMFALFLSNGMTATGITIFDPSLLDEFGWSRGDFKFRDALNFWCTALIAPFAGVLIDRVNPKWLLMFGFSLLTLGYFGYSMLGNGGPVLVIEIIALVAAIGIGGMLVVAFHTLLPKFNLRLAIGLVVVLIVLALYAYKTYWMGNALKQVYVIHLLFSLALSTAGSMVVIFLVSSWFVRHRGLAIGIALVGTSMGSALLPKINPYLIEEFGWRQAYFYNAFMPVVLIVFVLFFIKGTPKHAASTALGQADSVSDLKQHGLTFREAVRTKTFWAIGISGFLTYYAIFSFVQHAVLHANKTFGYSLREAGGVLFWFSLVAMAAKLISGAVADRVDRHRVFTVCFGIMLIGVIGLATLREDWLYPSALIIALGWGGLFTLYNMLAVNNFGLREIGRINGLISLLESFGVGLGSWMTGRLFDSSQSYGTAFTVVAVMVGLAMILSTQIRSEVDEKVLLKS